MGVNKVFSLVGKTRPHHSRVLKMQVIRITCFDEAIIMSTRISKLNKFMAAAVMVLFLAACGGGGGGGDSASNTVSSGGTGSVGLLLTDGPTDDFDAVNITVVKVELLSDSGHFTIFQGEETVNLLDYRDDARIFSLHPSVPAGTYEKIRLTLSNIELVKCEDGAVIQPIDVDTCRNTINPGDQPRLKGNNKLDLNPQGDFVVVPGGTLMVEIDIDAEKSIHIVETGNGKYQFRPVVFVKVITDSDPGKPVRVQGIIEDLDRVDREFVICSREINLLPSIDVVDGPIACVDVAYNDATLIFIGDVPVDPDDLHDGDLVTVFGNLHLGDRDDDVEHHAAEGDHHHFDGIFIEAVVIDIVPDDTDIALDGVALTAVNARSLFDMSVDPGQGFPNSKVKVLIHPEKCADCAIKRSDKSKAEFLDELIKSRMTVCFSKFNTGISISSLIALIRSFRSTRYDDSNTQIVSKTTRVVIKNDSFCLSALENKSYTIFDCNLSSCTKNRTIMLVSRAFIKLLSHPYFYRVIHFFNRYGILLFIFS